MLDDDSMAFALHDCRSSPLHLCFPLHGGKSSLHHPAPAQRPSPSHRLRKYPVSRPPRILDERGVQSSEEPAATSHQPKRRACRPCRHVNRRRCRPLSPSICEKRRDWEDILRRVSIGTFCAHPTADLGRPEGRTLCTVG